MDGDPMTRADRLRHFVKHGTPYAHAPIELYDGETDEMVEGQRPCGQFLCVTCQGGYESNPNYTVVHTLDEAVEQFTGELNDEGAWHPNDLIDLDTGNQMIARIKVIATLD